ncbi:hypothetical protein TRVL_03303 [Trypanosoma vivax]|nr:hypothetical protein TRVL_03303 [Trypanosoma vivax]
MRSEGVSMSGVAVEAEAALARCVEAMHDALHMAVFDALPKSFQVDEEGSGGALVDTVAQRLEWEQGTEIQRIDDLVNQLDRNFALLEAAVTRLPDAPVEMLDSDIAALNTEASLLAQQMIDTYDEAEALSAKLEAEIAAYSVPPM